MITTANLKTQSRDQLAKLAKARGISSSSSMSKEQLLKVLSKVPAKQVKGKPAPAAVKTSRMTKAAAPSNRASIVKPVAAVAPAVKAKPTAPKASAPKAVAGKPVAVPAKPMAKGTVKGSAHLNGNGKAALPVKTAPAAKPLPVKPAPAAPQMAKPSAPKLTTAKPAAMPVNGTAKNGAANSASVKAVAAPPAPKATSLAKPAVVPAPAPIAKKPEVVAKKIVPPKPIPSANPKATAKIQAVQQGRERMKDLSGSIGANPNTGGKSVNEMDKDRLVLMVRDAYWLHACWSVSRHSVKRAEAALAEHWHTARPVLRVMEVEAGQTTNSAERIHREIDVHGGVTNWYIDVASPPKSFRVDLGYLAANGRFYALARSNSVTTPVPGSADAIDQNWTDIAEDYERIYSLSGGYHEENSSSDLQELFEERLRRPMTSPLGTQFGSGAERSLNRHREFEFEVDAEMILFGTTKPDAHVSLAGEPVKLRPDGSFTIRLSMPDKRQVLPVVASSADGVEQRTVVIAVERNTKVLEPMMRENGE